MTESENCVIEEEKNNNQDIQQDNKPEVKSVIEALLFVSVKPLSISEISGFIGEKLTPEEIKNIMLELAADYSARGIQTVVVDNSYKMLTAPACAVYVERFLKVCTKQFLSKAALETLAIIALKQPVTRAQIEELRGVNVDKIINKLLEKKIIKEIGKAPIPGRPVLYGTTKEFLHYFNLKDLDELPKVHLDEEIEKLDEIEQYNESQIIQHVDEEDLQKSIEENESEIRNTNFGTNQD